jgi:UDP-N-acetylglucosamine--N-acetylmuramyl-(pentapeptide) pyrophosphoryl-undecaprenol N-acetylglucosamine transferase
MANSEASAKASRTEAKIAFTGGGTAGHVFPGIAVAQELGRPVIWIGSTDGVEGDLVRAAGIPFRHIPAGKLRRYFSLRNLSDFARIAAGFFAALRILKAERPALLFSKGGFVSVPPVVAARLCGIPSFTHESDFDPGLATRINMRFCEKVLVSFPETVKYIPERFRGKAVVTGNPVRSSLYTADPARGRTFVGCPAGTPMIFVIGGSLGSSFMNHAVAAALPRLLTRFFVVHQMGAKEHVASTRNGYFTAAFFAAELPDVMAGADLVVSRAGANVLAELAALGKASVLVPLSQSSSRGDQIRNAEVFRSRGAALVLAEAEASGQSLADAVEGLFSSPGELARMGQMARALGAGRPSAVIAKLLLERLA